MRIGAAPATVPRLGSEQRPERGSEGQVKTRPLAQPRLKRPRMHRILLHNDAHPPRDFVVLVLQQVFSQGQAEAARLMLYTHKNGVGVVGIYPRDVAENKVGEVRTVAEDAGYPLLCTHEPEHDGDESGRDGDPGR